MAIDYVRDIEPLQKQGLSNSEIASHLSDRTATKMNGSAASFLLKDAGAVLQNAVLINERTGSLIEFYKSMPEGENKNLLGWFIAEVSSNRDISTNEYPRSIQYALIELSLPPELQTVAEKLVSQCAGSRPDMGTTEQDVVDIQAAYESEKQIDDQLAALDQQYWSLHNQHIAPLQQSRNVNSADWKAGIQSMADGWVE